MPFLPPNQQRQSTEGKRMTQHEFIMPLAVLGMGSEALCVRIVHTSVRTYVRVCMHACD